MSRYYIVKREFPSSYSKTGYETYYVLKDREANDSDVNVGSWEHVNQMKRVREGYGEQ